MTRTVRSCVIALASLSPLAALDQAQVSGAWALDTEAFWREMLSSPEMKMVPAEESEMMKAMMISEMKQMKIEFKASGELVTTLSGGRTETHTPKWTSTGPTTAEVVTEEQGKKTSAKVAMPDAKTLTFTVVDQGRTVTMTFRPVTAEAPAAK
jgi:hypothetical protein